DVGELDRRRRGVEDEPVRLGGRAARDVGDLEDHRQLAVGDVRLGEGEVDERLAALAGVELVLQQVYAVDPDAGHALVVHGVAADPQVLGAPRGARARVGDGDHRGQGV